MSMWENDIDNSNDINDIIDQLLMMMNDMCKY